MVPVIILTVLLLAAIALIAALLVIQRRKAALANNLEKLLRDRAQSLEHTNSELSSVFSAIPDPVFIKDVAGEFVRFNVAFERLLGLTYDEITSMPTAEIYQRLDGGAFDFTITDQEVFDSKDMLVSEVIFHPAGSIRGRNFEVIKTPIFKHGEVTGVLCIARDVTQRKENEQAARAASIAKSDFLSRVSHEIRTPLNAIIGMTTIARKSLTDPEKAASSLDQIRTASAHLLDVLNDVLDMSKIESGKFEITSTVFSLNTMMFDVSSIITQRCNECNLRFKNNLSELDDLHLMGDSLRLKQVIINLLGNAVKFTRETGYVEFLVEQRDDSDENVTLDFTVSDNGIGMTAEQLDRLFTPFDQTDASVAAKFGGTGLGLAISQNLIKMMGGEITVDSEPNKGTSFKFSLSFKKATEDDEQKVERPECPDIDLSGRRILLVDDVMVNRLIMTELLNPTNAQFIEVENGQEAVSAFESSETGFFDLIFMDVQMPIMDGYEATGAIRRLDRDDAQTIPIIAMTANAYKEDVDKALAAGMDGHVAKPVDIDIVTRVLADLLT